MAPCPEPCSIPEGILAAPSPVDVKDGGALHLEKKAPQRPTGAQLRPDFLHKWDPERFVFHRLLPQATRTGCPLEIYTDGLTGAVVIAKRFPVDVVAARFRHTKKTGRLGWPELAVAQGLASQGLQGLCTCWGAFLDDQGDVLLMSEYIAGGDLFECALTLGKPGPERESRAMPVIQSLLKTVMRMHRCGVAHCDISLENILKRPGLDGEVVLIDFETAVLGTCRRKGICGKPSYQAPEMFERKVWDARAADLFSCGVVAYCLAMGSYPWTSTKPGVCRRFAIFQQFGFRAFLLKPALVGGRPTQQPIGSYMSAYLIRLLEVLLHPTPEARAGALALMCNEMTHGY